ncbi:unnamed protein product [Prorocentrum cordatum]|uniref:Amino acid transporter n=1 Tax=Prorocentrum cordatum TaxID=2364126 RepID=A0ABN9U604_9DINO|nr:unnamed protein product [Polarella glacialis]
MASPLAPSLSSAARRRLGVLTVMLSPLVLATSLDLPYKAKFIMVLLLFVLLVMRFLLCPVLFTGVLADVKKTDVMMETGMTTASSASPRSPLRTRRSPTATRSWASSVRSSPPLLPNRSNGDLELGWAKGNAWGGLPTLLQLRFGQRRGAAPLQGPHARGPGGT